MNSQAPKSVVFRREREAKWRRLQSIIGKFEKDGVRSLAPGEIIELPKLYRTVMSGLSVARAISLDRNLIEYLEALGARAYCCVYGSRGNGLATVMRFITTDFPRAVREQGGRLVLSASTIAAGVVLGFVETARDPELYYAFIDPGLAAGRDPLATTEELRSTLYPALKEFHGSLGSFAAFLFTHNTNVAILAFSLGIAAGIPILPLLLVTGSGLGALASVFSTRGFAKDFWGWILPHGITELLAICIAAASGLAIGKAMLFPREKRRIDAIVEEGQRGARAMLGVTGMLLIAGLIEGIFRQVEQDIDVRYGVALLTACFWLSYFGLAGRRAKGGRNV